MSRYEIREIDRSAETSIARDEIDRLRAELTRSQADEVEHRIESGKLRAELEETQRESVRYAVALGKAEATIERIRSRHVEYEGATASAGSECGYCFESWPCGTVEIINGEAEGEQ